MGLTEWLGTVAAGRAHVLVAAPRDAFRTRARLERAVVARGWALADAPADADVLAVCGRPEGETDEILAEALSSVWAGMPGPRMRVDVTDEAGIGPALERAAEALLDTRAHAADAESRDGDMDHGDMDHGDTDHGDMDHGDMDHGDMAPGGVPLAEGTEDDRDGLEMDVLHVPLGPVLRHWPAGVVLHCTLHGDLVARARVEVIPRGPGAAPTETDAAEVAALRCDAVADLLALAGWPAGHATACAARDAFLDAETASARAHLRVLRRRVRRNWPLTWMLRGLGTLQTGDLPEASGEAPHAALLGDVHDRLLTLLDLAGGQVEPVAAPTDAAGLEELVPRLVEGLELASARLVVASLDVPSLLAENEAAGV